ncbi:hypothetical protein M407DRAFT_23425 [Tulasnella calospora MUT 4182]|uniref:DUF6535 domain-containing protein n=1 Tax=Tulasnella calospora MUT 4182 TaxID=1051891 RepID=A0A0C3QJQ2_9AGAM|nr:hypothetical protein M407DRAFT_23425 [Tulasnella calospora MUT 4182]
MNTTAYAFEQPMTEPPEIPARFGEDGGKFYYYYDQLADDLDEDLTKRLKSQLDGLLIFAGLFAGLVKGGNATINAETDLPSATFSPPSAIYPVNVLFAVSLTCALMSSFLAVLGQQWLVYYRKRCGGGAEHQRKEQLRRQLGAQRCRLELVLDDILPGLLQVSLAIFCIAFILYLRTLSGPMSSIVAAIVGIALVITVGAAVCATWDRMCPYQSPLSHLFCWTLDRLKPMPVSLMWLFIFLKAYLYELLWARSRTERHLDAGELNSFTEALQMEELQVNHWELAQEITSRELTRVGRKEETANDLIVASVKRVILTSEHPAALIHAATNICAIDEKESLRQLLNDAEFVERFHDLFSIFSESAEKLPTQLQAVPAAATKAFATAILHLALSVGTIMDMARPKGRALAINNPPQAQPALSKGLVQAFCSLAKNVRLENNLLDGDLKDVNHLRLLGTLLHALFWGSLFSASDCKRYLRRAIKVLANLNTSHQLVCTLTCAVKMYVLYPKSGYHEEETERYERLAALFELAKSTYDDRHSSTKVQSLSEALQLSVELCNGENGDRSEVYWICLGVFGHACELKSVDLAGVFTPMGRLMRNIELDIRHPGIQESYQEQLRGYKDQYVAILSRRVADNLFFYITDEWCESLTGTLQYIREFADPHEPGHPENRVTLDLFRLLLTGLQRQTREDQIRDLVEEYERFGAWVDMGGCAKTIGRLNRDPELFWCPYAGR